MTIRTFIAVDISDEVRRKLADYIKKLRNDFAEVRVGWEKTEKLHLTLKFLGDTDEMQLSETKKIVEKIADATQKFKLKPDRNGVFPNPPNARILWTGVNDAGGNLTKINRDLEEECKRFGFRNESRKYHPHLTIARLKDSKSAADLVKKHLETKIEPLEFEVSEIFIYESRLQLGGSIYKKIFSASLRKEN